MSAVGHHVPTTLPVFPGAAVAGRYVFGDGPEPSRGDTLDALPIPDHRIALFVVDVVGAGEDAVRSVAPIRTILRERLGAGAGLLETMSALEREARHRPEMCAATLCVATLGLRDGSFEWASAGHPAPMWMSDVDDSHLLPSVPSRPLGMGGRAVTHSIRLDGGDMVCLYTNGLVTGHGRDLEKGLRRLLEAGGRAATAAASAADPSPHEPQRADAVCDRLLHSLGRAHVRGDDAALLLARRTTPPTEFALRCAATPENLPLIRHRINGWLDGLGAGLIDHVGLGHAVVELAANSIGHAYVDGAADPVVSVDAHLVSDGTVNVTVADRGRWREGPSAGRGLMMASGLVDAMRMERSGSGTKVELSQRLTRPVPLLRAVFDGAEVEDSPYLDESVELELDTRTGRMVASGPVDDLSVETFHAGLNTATRAGTADSVIDLDGITHLTSAGVQALFEFSARSARNGSHLEVRAAVGTPAAQVLEVVGLSPRS